jgi:hypothetical protein
MKEKLITIIVKGGRVCDVEGLPNDYLYEVYDLDTHKPITLKNQIKDIIKAHDKERGISKEKIWELLLISNKNEGIDKHDFSEKLQLLFNDGEIYESSIDRIRSLD